MPPPPTERLDIRGEYSRGEYSPPTKLCGFGETKPQGDTGAEDPMLLFMLLGMLFCEENLVPAASVFCCDDAYSEHELPGCVTSEDSGTKSFEPPPPPSTSRAA